MATNVAASERFPAERPIITAINRLRNITPHLNNPIGWNRTSVAMPALGCKQSLDFDM
jgi:hypothetical protein